MQRNGIKREESGDFIVKINGAACTGLYPRKHGIGITQVCNRKKREVNMRTKAKIKFIEFLRPGNRFAYPYTIEQAFNVFQWLVKTGSKYDTYGRSGVYDLMAMGPTCINHDIWYSHFYSIENLEKRFHYVFLYDDSWNKITTTWKKENDIGIDKTKWIYFNHYEPYGGYGRNLSEVQIEETLEKLLNSKNLKLNVSLNNCHPKAVWVEGVFIRIMPDYFEFVMDYGYKKDSSSWFHTLAKTENKESFIDTMFKAIEKFKSLTE
jgi:hypothetical protein